MNGILKITTKEVLWLPYTHIHSDMCTMKIKYASQN